MIDQLTYDPMMGSTNILSADGPVVLAWGSDVLVPVEVEGQTPRRIGNVLYYVPAGLAIKGATTFHADLLRSTVVASDAQMFTKDPMTHELRPGQRHRRLPADRVRRSDDRRPS